MHAKWPEKVHSLLSTAHHAAKADKEADHHVGREKEPIPWWLTRCVGCIGGQISSRGCLILQATPQCSNR